MIPEVYNEELTQIVSPLSKHTRDFLCSPDFSARLFKQGCHTIEEIFQVFRDYFYPMVRSGAKYDNDARRTEYYRCRRVAYKLSVYLHNDALWWHRDYEVYRQTRLFFRPSLTFLYKKCVKLRPSVITDLAWVPEYMDALEAYKGSINDNVVLDIVGLTHAELVAAGKDYRFANKVFEKIYADVNGT